MEEDTEHSELYIIASNEVDTDTQDNTLWRKAMALMGNNEEKAREKYIKLRINQLIKDGYQPKEKKNDKPKNKKRKSQEEDHQKKDDKPKNKKIADIAKKKHDNHAYESNKDSSKIDILSLVPWIFSSLVVASIIWYMNTGSDEKQPNSTIISNEDNRNVKIIKEKELTVEDYVLDTDLMQANEVKVREIREAKRREIKEEKEAADIEYIKAVQEMDREE